MSKLKQIFTNRRVIILIIFLLFFTFMIGPRFDTQGVAIRSIVPDSAAAAAIPLPLVSPAPASSPKSWEVLKSINGIPINTVADYYEYTANLEVNKTLLITTDKGTYRVKTRPLITTALQQTVTANGEAVVLDDQNIEGTDLAVAEEIELIGTEDIGIRVSEVPRNNIRKGLDLAGGTRVLLQPEEQISDEDMDILIQNIAKRLNVFGISDVVVRSVTDFTGEKYILVEIAGVNQDEVRQLLSQQGKFEAYVGETPVFQGGDDVVYVCRSAQCSGIDPYTGCGQSGAGYVCAFRFSISLSTQAAQALADATAELDVLYDLSGNSYLSENISLYLDNEEVDQLRIGSDLKGNAVVDISISGSGTGATQSAAAEDALANMRQLQTVLITGSLPVKLTIIQSDAISPVLGEEFLKNALYVGVLALLAVVLVITVRYRKAIIAIPTIVAMVSEVIILMGFAAFIGWRIDLAAIAGIIIAVGTGVDDQIVITDEALGAVKKGVNYSWKQKLKRAFFIIFTAYFTTVVAMIPLWFSGAGLLRGFALTTIAGVSIGVLITRPAFAAILEILLDKKDVEEE